MILRDDLLQAAYLIIPSYLANSMPLLFGGGRPIDGGRRFIDREPILGSNKTFRGFGAGLAFGVAAAVFEEIFLKPGLFFFGVLAALGALIGDMFAAFLKRRLGLKPGEPLPIVDQLDFVLGAILFAYPVYPLTFASILFVLLVTPPIHLLTNAGAYVLKLKKTYW